MLILIIAAVVGSNFAGPAKGWLTKAINSNKEVPSSEQGLQDGTVTAAPPVVETQEIARVIPKKENIQKNITTKAPTVPKQELSEFEIMHKKFIEEFLSKSKKPKIGTRYKVPTLTNAIRDGELEKLDEFKIYLVKVKPYNAKTSIHYSVLPKKAADYFFPEKAANSYANAKLEEYLKAQNKIPEVEEVIASDAPKKVIKKRSTSFSQFDITEGESSSRLAHAALEVNNYLSNQSRISKKREGIEFANVEKCHAKQHGRASVFYMYVPKSFAATSSEYKFQVIDGVRRFWALRCMSNAVSVASNAYLCVVYNGKIIGGSKLKDAEDTWAK